MSSTLQVTIKGFLPKIFGGLELVLIIGLTPVYKNFKGNNFVLLLKMINLMEKK
tara:strand:+ start:293 stop:454 length:162 start_codon:yes stop_codon:yes gene_type:complete